MRKAIASVDTQLRRVLFLCTANYYRSRFCEELFNHHAAAERLPLVAFSRALRESPAALNPGPMSPFAIDFLRKRGIRPVNHLRLPLTVTDFDFVASDLVVAVHEHEHRPLVDAAWPKYRDQVGYWQVADLDVCAPSVALAKLERQVVALLHKLSAPAADRARARGATG
jgi:low molecular weight protein-tyrosine phosphatase